MITSAPFTDANWIAAPFLGGPQVTSPSPFLRKKFELQEGVQSATLFITALGLYDAEINGRTIGNRVFAPGWTNYHKRVQYQVHEITKLCQTGENVLGVILGDGWYSGFIAWLPRQTYGDRPRLLAKLVIQYTNGSEQIILSDETWKVASGPILENDLIRGEAYDARMELPGWSTPGYEDASWQDVQIMPAPGIEISPSKGPGVVRQEILKPISETRKDEWGRSIRLFDFGQNFSGRVRLSVTASEGTTLTLKHAETLNPDGTPYYENLRTARAGDFYTCKGGGENWEPRFTFHGFRYLEVIGLSHESPLTVEGVVLHSDTPATGHFACSNPLLNQLQHNIVWGQKSNFLEVPTDCPQRDERLGWTGDAQVFVRTAAFQMDVREFFHKWMLDIRDTQSPEGAVPPIIPEPRKIIQDGGPAWSDATIICPWTIYLCYDDAKILADHYESMQRYVDYQLTERSLGRIRCHPDLEGWKGYGDWLALDGSGKTEGGTPPDLIGTAFMAYDLDLMVKIAAVLGFKQDAERYDVLRSEVVNAFRNRYLTPDGLLSSGTQTAAVLALHFGLVPETQIPTTVKELVRHIEKNDFHLATGFVGTPYLLDVLESHGHLDLAYRLLERETFPSWLFPAKNGATTIWERWDGWTPDKGFQTKGMNSFNHYAYGAVGAWMVKRVAGLDLDEDEPGYRHIRFQPRPGGSLTWAEATLKTAFGPVGIRWDLERDELKIRLTIPENTRATLSVPDGFSSTKTEFASGTHHLILPAD